MASFFYTSFILLFSLSLSAQSSYKQFRKLSKPERHWVLFHLCKAKKALRITKAIQVDVDSIKHSGVIGSDNSGGNLDAFKHAYWMASLAVKIGPRKAFKLGIAHEKGNYLQFKKHVMEESILPDSVSSLMDLFNNQEGIDAVAKCKALSKTTIQQKIMNVLESGNLAVIKKDEQGNYLTCKNEAIALKDWTGKWNIPKCIVPSGKQ